MVEPTSTCLSTHADRHVFECTHVIRHGVDRSFRCLDVVITEGYWTVVGIDAEPCSARSKEGLRAQNRNNDRPEWSSATDDRSRPPRTAMLVSKVSRKM